MPGPSDDQKLESERLAKAKFERDKALKEQSGRPLWSKEIWQAAAAADRAGVIQPERRFPVIITTSQGPFTTPQKLQEVAGLPSVPEVRETTRTSIWDPDVEEECRRAVCKHPAERMRYCDVNWYQLLRVKQYSDGEEPLVWFQGKKRAAWLAHSTKQKSDQYDGGKHDVAPCPTGS